MNKKLLLAATACMTLSAISTAYAQNTQPPATPDSEVGELIITANKREESIQDVPVAVSAFTSETRDLLGVTSIFDLTNNVPGLAYSVGLDRTFIRGIGRNTNAPGTDPGVAIYTDGVYSASTVPIGRTSLFAERTEVLRGPQGTLYGRNSMGGAMNVISTRPGKEFAGEFRTSIGDHDNKQVALKIGGPITSWLRYQGGAVLVDQTDGYYHNTSGLTDEGGVNSEKYYVGMLDFNVGEKVDGFVRYESYSYDRANRGLVQSTVSLTPYDTTTRTGGLSVNPYYGYTGPANPALTNPYLFATDTPNHTSDHNTYNVQSNLTWHLPLLDVKYIGGYSQYVYDSTFDDDGSARGSFSYTPAPFNFTPYGYPATVAQTPVIIHPRIGNYLENKKFSSHELNFTSTYDSPLQWIGGLYYYQENFLNVYRTYSPLQAELATVPGNTDRNYVLKPSLNDGKSYAAFGQVDYKFAEKFKITLGLRYNRDQKEGTENLKYYYFLPTVTTTGSPFVNPAFGFTQPGNYGLYAGSGLSAFNVGNASPTATCPTTLQPGTTCSVDTATNTRYTSGEWDDFSGTAGIAYEPNDDTLIYAKYSRGFKAGGINMSVGALSPSPFTKPETLNAYEIGYKFRPGRNLTLNTAVYYYDFRNYQDFDSVFNPVTLTLTAVGINIDKSRIKGADLEFNWHPTSQFTLLGNYSYIDARIVQACCFVDPRDANASGAGANPSGPTTTLGEQPQSIAGNHLKGSPENKFGVTGLYRFDFDKGSLNLSATYNWRSGVYSTFFDRSANPITDVADTAYKSPAFGSVNLRAVWEGAGKKYTVIGFVNNVANDKGYEYVSAGFTSGGNPTTSQTLTIPRTYGLEIQRRF